ncbi:rho GTPase-activating protein gacK-like [Penaeus japonicus]|uniref:rho GTPase-activating protein gacK-like n=1 Tax=Penaeus japonicus TaxID=27405 RepID=UPI001C71538D|nr:rho GTPase-activating protein gacK-like [Penaeus japonicus]
MALKTMNEEPKMLLLLLAVTAGLPASGLGTKSFFYRHAEGFRCGSPLATSLVSSLTGCAALCTQESTCVGFSLEVPGSRRRSCHMTAASFSCSADSAFNFYLAAGTAAAATPTPAPTSTTTPSPAPFSTAVASTTTAPAAPTTTTAAPTTTTAAPTTTTAAPTTTTLLQLQQQLLQPQQLQLLQLRQQLLQLQHSYNHNNNSYNHNGGSYNDSSSYNNYSSPYNNNNGSYNNHHSSSYNYNKASCGDTDQTAGLVGIELHGNLKSISKMFLRSLPLKTTSAEDKDLNESCSSSRVVTAGICSNGGSFQCTEVESGVTVTSTCHSVDANGGSAHCSDGEFVIGFTESRSDKIDTIECCQVTI